MAVRRAGNWLGELRVDVPDVRAIESSIRNDFDELFSSMVIGNLGDLVIRGFELVMTGSIGNAANTLSMIVSDSAMLHGTSLTSGTFFVIRPGVANQVLNSATNPNVVGSFSPNSANYISLDFARTIDATTSAPRAIWDPTNKIEVSMILPLAETLNFVINITQSAFAANTLPICIVDTNGANAVTEITDQRNMLGRLGQAGLGTPNPYYQYPWTNDPYGQLENPPSTTNLSVNPNPFEGGDKMIKQLKEWMDAVMSMILDIKGTTFWYSVNTGGGSIVNLRADAINTIVTSAGSMSHGGPNTGTTVSPIFVPGLLNWTLPIQLRVLGTEFSYQINSNVSTTDITLADQEVAYINLVRDQPTSQLLVFTNGSPVVTSVASISWTTGLVAGDYIKEQGATQAGYYEILSVDSASQVTLTTNFTGTSTGSGGINALYGYGVYFTSPTPSSNRNVFIAARPAVPIADNMFWIAMRDDNSGVTPKIYTRFKSGELLEGESILIADEVPQQTLQFIGSPGEQVAFPNFTNLTYDGGNPEPFQIVNGVDSLTSAISATIGNVNTIWEDLFGPTYEESIDIVASSPGFEQSLPISSGSMVMLPLQSRIAGTPQQFYVVGFGALEVLLNGQLLILNKTNGWTEVGPTDTQSNSITINQDLVVGDTLTFRLSVVGGPPAGGSGSGAPPFMTDPNSTNATNSSTVGQRIFLGIYDEATSTYYNQVKSVFQESARDLTINSQTSGSHIVSNYTATDADDMMIVDATSGNITITVPQATTGRSGKVFDVKKIDSSANTVTIVEAIGANIDGSPSLVLTVQYQEWTIVKDQTSAQYWIK